MAAIQTSAGTWISCRRVQERGLPVRVNAGVFDRGSFLDQPFR